VVDLPRRVAGAAHLDLDVLAADEYRLAPRLAARTQIATSASAVDAVVRVARQVERPRQPANTFSRPPSSQARAVRLDAAVPESGTSAISTSRVSDSNGAVRTPKKR
jgi:hypothetical protein